MGAVTTGLLIHIGWNTNLVLLWYKHSSLN